MYLSASQYNDFLAESRGLEKNQEARYGIFLFSSVLLHLILFFCFMALNHENRGYLLPGENVVEVDLVSTGIVHHPAESVSQRKNSSEKMEVVKNTSVPVSVIKKPVKQEMRPEKPVERPVMVKEIDPPENNSVTQSIHVLPDIEYQNSTIPGSMPDSNAVSEKNPENNESYEQNPVKGLDWHSGEPVSTANSVVSQEKHYVDKNFYYVKDLITRNLIYPAVARRMKWQGTVEVSFVVLETGNVKNIRIVASSGHSVLDKNVIAAIEQVQPFPPPPVQAEFSMPIKYTLKN